MSRNGFLGTLDFSITSSLLKNYNVPTKIPDAVKLNTIKRQDDLLLIELGTILTPYECDEILTSINEENFVTMLDKYDITKRNNSRLIVMDDRLARTIWRRLKFSNKLTKLIDTTRPLGFNVQGNWELSGVNAAMRLNKYNEGEYFAPHKDAQYAPNADERSLLSLLIYLTDTYENGQTKFYFPKVVPESNLKGLTINEEIDAHGGLENGYECVTVKPKKGFAVLFTHNLLHEATSPVKMDELDMSPRYVLRTDVVTKRKEKSQSYAVCADEQEDYFACLNFFREAQQNELKQHRGILNSTIEIGELYERSLSIRYCYPRLLKTAIQQDEQHLLFEKLPPELLLHIFKFLQEQDVHNFIYAYPKYQMMKIVWQTQQAKQVEADRFKSKYIPTIDSQYGSQTLFRFADAEFFSQHFDECCRVVAVYAFFLLGHGQDSETYTIRYNRYTQEACEVNMEKLLSDVFYNRNCYGSLYRVKQKNGKREPMIDLDYSVDRTFMTNRHQSQFIGQDLISRLHLKIEESPSSDIDSSNQSDDDNELEEEHILAYQRRLALFNTDEKLVDDYLNTDFDEWNMCIRDHVLGYREHLLNQIEQSTGICLFRMISAENHRIESPCNCPLTSSNIDEVRDLIRFYNHLVFDFDTHRLAVEKLPWKETSSHRCSLLSNCAVILRKSISLKSPISYYRVNIEKLAKETKGFNHASCNCYYPAVTVNEFSFFDYTHLFNVHLAIIQNDNNMFVLTTYGGVAAL